VLVDRKNWSPHRPWAYLTVAATVGASIWYFGTALTSADWPGGSSKPGFVFGVIGGLICLFEFLLWPRKMVRSWRLGRAQVWLRAHIWLGLLAVPLLVYHSGFRLGGTLSAAVMVLFLFVIVSGIWGLTVQQFLPWAMLQEVPVETLYSEIPGIMAQLRRDADHLVQATCGPGDDAKGTKVEPGPLELASRRRLTIQVQPRSLETPVPSVPVEGSDALRAFYREQVEPFLRDGRRSDSPLRHPNRSQALFRQVRLLLPPAARESVAFLENCCAQRRQLDLQARLHFWLHNWLLVHLPLAAALITLMLVHAWMAIKYW
jgi:hypothetical protein